MSEPGVVLLYLLAAVIGWVLLYVVIRLAVKHAIQSAQRPHRSQVSNTHAPTAPGPERPTAWWESPPSN